MLYPLQGGRSVGLPTSLQGIQHDMLLHHRNIQGDSGGICETSGNDSMCDSKQKSSYEHGSDFERLRSCDRLKLRIEGNDY